MIDWTKWKLVPVEATPEMCRSAGTSTILAEAVYTAMLAAAPPAPVVEVTDEMAERVTQIYDRLEIRLDCSTEAALGYDKISAVQQVLGPTWVAVGVRGNWSVEDLAKPNGENIVADCGNDPWSESNARKIAKAQDEITAIRARIAELERDAARLDWIANSANSVDRPIEEGRGPWMLWPRYGTLRATRGKTLREAIDKAMEAWK